MVPFYCSLSCRHDVLGKMNCSKDNFSDINGCLVNSTKDRQMELSLGLGVWIVSFSSVSLDHSTFLPSILPYLLSFLSSSPSLHPYLPSFFFLILLVGLIIVLELVTCTHQACIWKTFSMKQEI